MALSTLARRPDGRPAPRPDGGTVRHIADANARMNPEVERRPRISTNA